MEKLTELQKALMGKQLTFPDGSRIVLLGRRIVYMNPDFKFIPLKIERVKR